MKTLKQVEVIPVFVEFIPDVSDMEQGKIYVSEEYETTNHLCLCGCGEQTVVPIIGSPHGWIMTKKNGKISLTPSIGNYSFDCQSHYIITNNIANFV